MQLTQTFKRFFFSEFDPIVLSFFRMIFGMYLIIFYIALFPNWENYYGPGGVRPELPQMLSWSLFDLTQNWISVSIYWWLGFICSLAFTLGWMTRISTILLFLIQSSMNHSNPMMVNGEDLVIRMLLFYSIFSPLDYSISISNFLNAPKQNRRLPWIWPLRLMQINITLIYAFSLPLKLAADPSWLNGEALYWVMMTSTWNRWPWQSFFYDGYLSKVLTISTVLVELSFPFLIWFERTRIPILVAITFFHFGLGIGLQNVSFFSFAMVCSFVLFIPEEVLYRFIDRPSHIYHF
jgi:hypothetical protein